MELQGTVKTVSPIIERGANNFKTAKIILDRTTTYQGQTYPNFTEVSLIGNKTELIAQSGIAPGDFVKVTGDMQGRFFQHEGKEKFAQDFNAWKIEVQRKAESPESAAQNSVY